MYKIRFNLGRGENYKKWKVTNPDNSYTIYDLDKQLLLVDAKLKNNVNSATKIFNGHNKFVCAWIEAEEIKVIDKVIINNNFKQLMYNPRIKPFWFDNYNNNIDNKRFSKLITLDNKIYLDVND